MEAIPTGSAGQGPTRAARGKSGTTTKGDSAKPKDKSRSKAKVELPEAMPDPAEINHTIATTAYYLAAARNFEPGHELEDWLEAERRVRATAL